MKSMELNANHTCILNVSCTCQPASKTSKNKTDVTGEWDDDDDLLTIFSEKYAF
jgi:hypothetical protein